MQSTASNSFPILTGSSTHSQFIKELKAHCMSNFGPSGQEVISGITIPLTHLHPGPTPNYFSERLHPRSHDPIPDTFKYAREAPSEAQVQDEAFDPETLPLTASAKSELQHDLTVHSRQAKDHSDEIDKRKNHDTDLLNFILQRCSSTVKDTVKTNTKMTAFEVNSADPTNFHRAFEYLDILKDQYSKGNSMTTVTEVTHYLNMEQGADSTAIFFVKAQDQLNKVTPLIESPTHKGYVAINKLKSMVLIKGLDKSQPANLRALEIHMQTHQGITSLDVPDELIASVLALQDSDLVPSTTTDPEQSSVFLSTAAKATTKPTPTTKPDPKRSKLTSSASIITTTKPPRLPGTKIPERDDHCPFCHAQSKGTKYFYHPEDQCRNKVRAGLQANVASVASTTPPLTLQTCFEFLQSQGYSFENSPDPPDDN